MANENRQAPYLRAPVRDPLMQAMRRPVPGVARPLVSVAMPVHNRLRYCAEAIDSILNQTMRDFEFIIVDDGSSDGTSTFLDWYCGLDERIRLFRNETNRGISASLNLAIAQARSSLIARMDSDDASLPERLARQVAFMTTHPEILAAGSDFLTMDADGKVSGQPVRMETDPHRVRQILLRGPALASPTAMLRRDAVLAVGGYRTAFDHAEDFDLWLRLSEIGDLCNIPEVLLHYRNHGGNVHHTSRRRQAFLAEMAGLAARRRRAGLSDPVEAGTRYEEAEMAELLEWTDDARQAFLQRLG